MSHYHNASATCRQHHRTWHYVQCSASRTDSGLLLSSSSHQVKTCLINSSSSHQGCLISPASLRLRPCLSGSTSLDSSSESRHNLRVSAAYAHRLVFSTRVMWPCQLGFSTLLTFSTESTRLLITVQLTIHPCLPCSSSSSHARLAHHSISHPYSQLIQSCSTHCSCSGFAYS